MSIMSTLKILFQNVRSLHLNSYGCDHSVQAAHVNIFVESALSEMTMIHKTALMEELSCVYQ